MLSSAKLLTIVTATLCAMLVASCANTRDGASLSLEPTPIAEVQARTTVTSAPARPVVALVLGGGGLRGYAHVGVLMALEELGVQPDIVVGTSAGAVVGAAYASGLTPLQIKAAALNVRIPSLIDLTLSTEGLIRGNSLANWVDGVTNNVPVESFPRRYAAVATDLQSGEPMLLERGSAGSVVQASAAVPGVNIPVAYRGGRLIDGGVTSLVPVRFARAMGADMVIAVDIYCQSPRTNGVAFPQVVGWVMHAQSCLVAQAEKSLADVLIAPAIDVPGMSSKEAKERAIQAGYDAARSALGNRPKLFTLRRSTSIQNAQTQ